jgi:hypothetical protein
LEICEGSRPHLGVRERKAQSFVIVLTFCGSYNTVWGGRSNVPMTPACAVIAAGAFLVVVIFVWTTHEITARRLGEIQSELAELHVEVSRLFVIALNADPGASKVEANVAPAESNGSEAAGEHHENTLPSPALEAEMAEVHELCAKLITLVPPAEAVPPLQQHGPSEGNGVEGRRRLPPGPQGYPTVKASWTG